MVCLPAGKNGRGSGYNDRVVRSVFDTGVFPNAPLRKVSTRSGWGFGSWPGDAQVEAVAGSAREVSELR